jgi:hypothetical protein
MRTINLLLLLTFVMPFVGCRDVSPANNVAVQIVNRSGKAIDYLSFSTNRGQGSVQKPGLKQQQTLAFNFEFANVDKTDGSYRLRYKVAASADTLTETFGYYTNGYPLDSQLDIAVYDDSMSVRTTPKKSSY